MSELRIDCLRQPLFDLLDAFRDPAETRRVPLDVATTFCVSDNRQAFPQRACQFCVNRLHQETLERAALLRKRAIVATETKTILIVNDVVALMGLTREGMT